jgi:hypothetical protein
MNEIVAKRMELKVMKKYSGQANQGRRKRGPGQKPNAKRQPAK